MLKRILNIIVSYLRTSINYMPNIILVDGASWETLRPLTLTRPIAKCMLGMSTIEEKWKRHLDGEYSCFTKSYLSPLFPTRWSDDNTLINSSILPTAHLVKAIIALQEGEVLMDRDEYVAFKWPTEIKNLDGIPPVISKLKPIQIETERVIYPEDILKYCDQEFHADYRAITDGRTSAQADPSVKIRGQEIFIEQSAKVYDCILNATEGPIYIGHSAEIMENAVIKGPACIGDNSTVHVGTKVYAHTMLGPWSKIGGEIKRSTIFGYSNKAHDGYLGDSVIGQWCNMGADTNNSNMKNTFGMVSLWDMTEGDYRITERQFLGLIMGDHSMCAINTAFMTGSVTGVFANVFGSIPDRWMPSFSWGDSDTSYDIDRAITVAARAQSRRNINTSAAYAQMLRHIAHIS